MQLDIIMEFSIDTLDDIVVLSPILAFGPILAPFSILQFLPMMDGLITQLSNSMFVDLSIILFSLQTVSYTHLTLPTKA